MRVSGARASLLLAAFLALALLIAAGPRARAEDGDDPAGDALAVHIRTVAPRVSPWGDWLVRLAGRIKKETLTAISPRLDWEQKSEAALVKQCQQGKVAGILVSFGALAGAVPELNALELPFLFADYASVDRALNAAEPLIRRLMLEQGLVFGMRGEVGFRHFALKAAPAVAPADFAGLALRAQPGELGKAVLAALGAVPTALGNGEVADALARDAIAGYDHSLLFGRLFGWTAAVKHVTLSAHAYQGAVLAWCKPWLDRLQPELQSALQRPDEALEASELALVRTFNDTFMPEAYARDGITLRPVDRGERAALEAALAPVVAKWRASASPAGIALLERLEKRR